MIRTSLLILALVSATSASAANCAGVAVEQYGRKAATPNHVIEAMAGKENGRAVYIVREWTVGGFSDAKQTAEPAGLEWRAPTAGDALRLGCKL